MSGVHTAAMAIGVRVGPFYAFTTGSITRAALAWWLLPIWGMWLILRFYWWLLVNLVMMIIWVVTVAIPAVVAAVRRFRGRRASRKSPADTPPGPRDWSPPPAEKEPAA